MNPAFKIRPTGSVGSERSLHNVVDALCEANLVRHGSPFGHATLPSRDVLRKVISQLRSALFPWHFGAAELSEESLPYYVGRTLDTAIADLEKQIYLGLVFKCTHGGAPCLACGSEAKQRTQQFVRALPLVRSLLGTDVLAAYEGDPAAQSADEAIFCYPGISAIFHHRLAHELFRLGVPLIPRIISELAHSTTGIDIHPGATIGSRFFIDHGTGVVIGETCVIGERVRLYQGVTLGAKSFPTDESGRLIKGARRHPVVEDDVVIYAGATVLGVITIGRGSTIGGNVWLTESVGPASRVTQPHFQRNWFESGAGI